MHPIFAVGGFMRKLDSLSYKTDVHTDWEGCVRVCNLLFDNKDCRCLCLVDVAQNGWVNHVKLCLLCMVYLLLLCLLISCALIALTIGIGAMLECWCC